jgi:hypothetical protein
VAFSKLDKHMARHYELGEIAEHDDAIDSAVDSDDEHDDDYDDDMQQRNRNQPAKLQQQQSICRSLNHCCIRVASSSVLTSCSDC